MISAAQMHLYLALFLHRDDFGRPDSSLSCSFSPQGLFRPFRFISILLFFSAGMISSARIHPQLAFLCRRDYFFRPDSSLSCSFSPQGLLRPPEFILILLFCAAGIISSAQMHLYLALSHRRDYFRRPASSLSCSFLPQGLFPPPGFISILFFHAAGITSAARIHPQLAFFTTGIISTVQIHLYLAFFFRRDDFFCSDASLSCSFSPQGLLRPPGFILILLFRAAGIIATARIHLYLALPCHRDYFDRSDSSLSCSSVLQGLFLPPGFILILLFSSAGIISDCDDPP